MMGMQQIVPFAKETFSIGMELPGTKENQEMWEYARKHGPEAFRKYFAQRIAAVAEEEAQRIAACGSVSLRLTKGVTDDIAAAVHSVGPAENGRCVVVLSCREYLAETTQLRHQTAQIVLHSYTGLRLPSVCLRQSDDGKLGVYCVQGSFPQFKPVEMVYQGDDYVLVSVPQNTEGLSTLRPGDEVIMTGVTLDGTQILKED